MFYTTLDDLSGLLCRVASFGCAVVQSYNIILINSNQDKERACNKGVMTVVMVYDVACDDVDQNDKTQKEVDDQQKFSF